MCLTIPGKLIKIEEDGFVVSYGDEHRKILVSMIDNLELGDYVVVSNKMIISKVKREKARKFLEIIE